MSCEKLMPVCLNSPEFADNGNANEKCLTTSQTKKVSMTLAMAWVGQRKDGMKHLYIASDSRTRGGMVLDLCPKILPLPRSDCAICFAGDTAATYPLMLQLAGAINSHLPAKERSLDIRTLKPHILRVFTDIINNVKDALEPIKPDDVQFLFCGYSWLSKTFEIWTFYYSATEKKFAARPAKNMHSMMGQVAFIGDVAKKARAIFIQRLNSYQNVEPSHFEFEPFMVLRDMLRKAELHDTIGGAPQLVKIAEHMNTKVLGVKWKDGKESYTTIMGRRVFDYENTDNVTIDPDTFEYYRPRSFGYRDSG